MRNSAKKIEMIENKYQEQIKRSLYYYYYSLLQFFFQKIPN